jgi:hypothetical protein
LPARPPIQQAQAKVKVAKAKDEVVEAADVTDVEESDPESEKE